MSDLKPIEGTELTEYVINLLQKHNIRSATDFLCFDENKLPKITNLSEAQISAIKVKLRRIYGPQVVDAMFYCSPCWKIKYTTGIENLDSMMGDEFRPGRVYEICGYSASGKSLLCSTIALNFAHNHSAEVLYLDTKKDFSGTRIQRMLNARRLSKEEIGRIMQLIKVEQCFRLRDLIKILQTLLEYLRQKKVSFKLIIIDSLPAVWYLFHGEDGSRKGKSLLTQCANLLKQIAKEHQVFVICVNVMVHNISEEELTSAEDKFEMAEKQLCSDQMLAPTSKPSLGKCWEAVPTIRLTIEDQFYDAMINEVSTSRNDDAQNPVKKYNKDQRIIRVARSCFSQTGSECTIAVADTGMY